MMSPLPSAGEHRTRRMTGAQGVTRRPQPPSQTNDGHPARDGRLAYVGFYESNPNTWCGEYQETSCNSEEQLLTTEVAVTHHLYRILRIAASYDRCDLFPCEPSQEAKPEDQARLVIVNTRRAALTLYQICAQRVEGASYHLSTLMCPEHRRQVLTKIRNRLIDGLRTLCISTQLIESGVDVDFGAVIRHVAGMDSIAQAAGRCNRNGRRAISRVQVINPADERIDRLIDIREGRNVAQRVLDEFERNRHAFDGDLLGPAAMTKYFDYYFAQRAREMVYPVSPDAAMRDDSLLNLLAENRLAAHDYTQHRGSAPPLQLRQAFMTAAKAFRAIDAPTQGVIVPYGVEGEELVAQLCGSFKPELQFDLLRRAQRFSVNVFPSVFDVLQRADAIHEIGDGIGIYHLRPEYYSQEFGLSETPASSMETLYV